MGKQTPRINKRSARKTKRTSKRLFNDLQVSRDTKQVAPGSGRTSCDGHRRSRRQRIAPVAFWDGASVKYDDDGTLIGIESVITSSGVL